MGLLPYLTQGEKSRHRPHRIERWRAHSTQRGTFRIALTAGDGARHHRNCRDFLSARHVLLVNQAITLVFAVVLSVLSLFISIQLHREEVVESENEDESTLGIEFAAMAALACFIALSMAFGIAATANLHLGHLGGFLWLVLAIIPAIILFALVLTDLSFEVFRTYIEHHWTSKAMNLLRRQACPRSWRRRCRTPIRAPEGFSSITAWCINQFQRTDCESLRRRGVKNAWDLVRWTSSLTAAVAWTEAVMLVWSVRLVVIILTPAVVLDAAMRFYIYVLLPLALAGFSIGFDLRKHPATKIDSTVETIGNLFVSASVLIIVAVILGRAAAVARSVKAVITFLLLVAAVLVLCVLVASFALTAFVTLSDKVQKRFDRQDLDQLACDIGLTGCSGCNLRPPQCREWRISEIVKYAEAYIKFGGFLAIVSIPPTIAALYVGIHLHGVYRDYQSAYI